MSLSPGTRLGAFEILNPLGAGGMGDVYKARDTRLGRFVAIKVLKAETLSSRDALDRFEREARTISQLSHPNICALHDVGMAPHAEAGGASGSIHFLVMELLDGETLASRLTKGALPLAQGLRYAIDIAGALGAAHRLGIVHRDLKPGNVMLTKSGIKLLDFGLAKPAPLTQQGEMTAAPETVAAMSQEGTIAGTLQYMSPEQLEGRPLDVRSDIFAFGAVLYEMATGKQAFTAGSPMGVASAILREQPAPMRSIEAEAPRALDRLVRDCLAKDPDERWHSIHDVKLQLEAIAESPADAGISALAVEPRRSRLPWVLFGIAASVAITAFVALWVRPGASPVNARPVVRFAIAPPDGGAFGDTVETLCIALSPDGSQLAYIASDRKGDRQIWLRPMTSLEGRGVPGTVGARALVWSPDGRALAFFAGDKLKRVDLPDGAPVTLSDVPNVRVTASWGAEHILFAAVPGGIFRVPVGGGAPVLELEANRDRKEIAVTWPWFLPDGRRFLYLSRTAVGAGTVRVAEVGQPGRDLLTAVSAVQYVDPGYLVFARDSVLLGQRVDPVTLQMIGAPFQIAEPVRYFYSTGAGTFTTSRNGVLVYQAHLERGRLVWLDRTGREVGVVSDSNAYSDARISRDGRRVLFSRSDPQLGSYDLFAYDIERQVEQRLTHEQTSEFGAVWLPGDERAVFSGGAPPHLFRISLASGAVEPVIPAGFQLAEDLSPDGKTLLMTQRTPRGNFDIWTMAADGTGKPAPLLETPFDEAGVRFSPDGHFIAFASDETGRFEVYVAPYPLTGGKTRLSTAGGMLPRWRRDGRELFYLSSDMHLTAVPVGTAPLTIGKPAALFAVKSASKWDDARLVDGWSDFDVSADGSRFLATVALPANEQPLTAVLNWPGDVRK